MKRESLLLCLEAAKQLHSRPWARTSVEIAYEVGLTCVLMSNFAHCSTDQNKA